MTVAAAGGLRRGMTAPERRLWGAVRGGQVGVKLRRQVPIGRYVVDFFCPAARLIVEVDGATHVGRTSDAVRDGWLTAEGYRVLRVWNNEVMGNLEGVLQVILLASRGEDPSPNPLPQGERAFAAAARGRR